MATKLTGAIILFVLLPFCFAQSSARPTTSKMEREIEYANAEFFRAVVNRNKPVLEKRVADDAILSGVGGAETDSKGSFLHSLRRSRVKSITLEDWTVKPQRRTVVVVGEYSLNMANSKLHLPIGFMNVFVKRNGRWQVLASYVAPVDAPEENSDVD